MAEHPQIYFHLGLGKTGTTFLQYRAFPYFKGFQYIQRTKYRRAKEIIAKSNSERFFLSFECDQQLERVAKDWAKDFPDTIPILVFRRQDSWIASQFRRFLKNCNVTRFEELFDLENDTGKFKRKDLVFMPMISMIESTFTNKPIILLYDDMRSDPKTFISILARRMGSSVDVDRLDFSKKHSSYSDRQLAFVRKVSRYIPLRNKVVYSNRVIEFFRKSSVSWTRYLILFIGKFWPDQLKGKPLITTDSLKAVKEEYAQDWNEVVEYVRKNQVVNAFHD
jgi:hypothetical protein